jgi:hypothetical protein
MPRDLTPLPPDEKERAVRVASTHRKVEPYLQGRNRAVVVERNLSERGRPDGKEQAVVGLYDYSNNKSLVAIVDLENETVVATEETPVQFQLDDEEARRAEELAGDDARVEEFLAGRDMNPLTRLYFPPTAAKDDPPHRYAIVFVRPTRSERRYAVVDLSEERVVDVLGPLEFTAQ